MCTYTCLLLYAGLFRSILHFGCKQPFVFQNTDHVYVIDTQRTCLILKIESFWDQAIKQIWWWYNRVAKTPERCYTANLNAVIRAPTFLSNSLLLIAKRLMPTSDVHEYQRHKKRRNGDCYAQCTSLSDFDISIRLMVLLRAVPLSKRQILPCVCIL